MAGLEERERERHDRGLWVKEGETDMDINASSIIKAAKSSKLFKGCSQLLVLNLKICRKHNNI